MEPKNLDKVLLETLYLREQLPMVEIGKRLGVSTGTILNYLQKYALPSRTRGESLRLAYQRGLKKPSWQGKYDVAHHRFEGEGRRILHNGYVYVRVSRQHPFFPMATYKGLYIPEHRLIMAQHLGRILLSKEQVHHINGQTEDNRLENLKLLSLYQHSEYSALCSQCSLRKEIRLLRWQIKELTATLQLKLGLEISNGA